MENDDPASAENIAKRLEWFINHLGLAQNDFAESISALPSQVNNWVKARNRVSFDGALKINRVYGLSLDFIILGRLDSLPPELIKSFSDFSSQDMDSNNNVLNTNESKDLPLS